MHTSSNATSKLLLRPRPEQHGTDQPAEQTCAENKAEYARRDVPCNGDLGCDERDRLHVEAVHHRDESAQSNDQDLEAPDALRVDKCFQIDLIRRVHVSSCASQLGSCARCERFL
jgi:hypothetical protein